MSDREGVMSRPWTRLLPWAALVLGLVYLVLACRTPAPTGPFALSELARIPVSYKGRVKPIDTVARNCLLMVGGRQTLAAGKRRLPAIDWLLDVLARPEAAEGHAVFRIDHPDVRAILGPDHADRKYFTAAMVRDQAGEIMRQARLAAEAPPAARDVFQRKLLELASHVNLYEGLAEYQGWLRRQMPQVSGRAALEAFFNHVDPFRRASALYLVSALLVFAAWLRGGRPLMATAWVLLLLGLGVHTLGLATRVYLSGRPPVTNLYSSAVFIGLACAVLCVVLERLFRGGVGMLLAAVSGFLTLLVAHALAGDGDTMAVLQAVLDTNFWLATHVVAITLGYSATFLAGLLGIVYIARGLFTGTLTGPQRHAMGQMIYGIVCFALLFSFIGTLLGGIWADQSWGRFRGWDPKEHGALLLVLWNALILHARGGGMARSRGMAMLAVFGNVVTAWSWFGTNMLGVGLHAYGFIDSAVFWLALFVLSQLLVLALGCVPLRRWRSFNHGGPPEPATR